MTLNKQIAIYISAMLLAIFVGRICVHPSKMNLLIFATFIMGLACFFIPLKSLLYIIVFSIPFPIYITFQGKDAATITTILIIILFLFWLSKLMITRHSLLVTRDKIILPILLLALIYIISFAKVPSSLAGPAIRRLLGYLSSLMLFSLLVYHTRDLKGLFRLIHIVNTIVFLQALVAIAQVFIPDKVGFLQIFSPRLGTVSAWITQISGEWAFRARGTIGDYELLAEWFALVIPLQLYMVSYHPKYRLPYIIFLLFSTTGLVLTLTRGAVICLGIGIIFFYILLIKRQHSNRVGLVKFIAPLVLISGGFFFIIPQFMSFFSSRFAFIKMRELSITSFFDAINRGALWRRHLPIIKDLTVFGHGPYLPGSLGLRGIGSLHSLYLTLLYQIGIVGLFAFLWFVAILFKRLMSAFRFVEDECKYALIAVCTSVLLIFLIDEIKIEFVRTAPTSQFTLLIFAFIFIVSNISSNKIDRR